MPVTAAYGKVISRDGELATVKLICDRVTHSSKDAYHCDACKFFEKNKESENIPVKNTSNAKEGEIVQIKLEKNAELKSAALLLAIPMLIFIITAGIFSALNIATWLICLISFSSIVITLTVLKFELKNKTYYYTEEVKEKNDNLDPDSST